MSSPSPSCWQGHLGCAGPVSSHAVRGAGSADSSQARKLRGRGGGETSGLQAATHGCLLPSPAPGLGGGTLAGEKGTTLEPQVAQAQLEKQAGPVVAETATGRGNGRRRRAGSHSRVLASATRGGLVVGTSDGPQEGGGQAAGTQPSVWPFSACGLGGHLSHWAHVQVGGVLHQGSSGDRKRSLHPSELWFSPVAWVATRGLVPPGPPVHSRHHWALALSSSLCTVLYSTWKCWTAVYAMPRYAPMHTASSRSKMAGLTL